MSQPSKSQKGPVAERIVVDEVFDNGTARLLRAKKKPGAKPDDFRIEAWGDESEFVMDAWRVAAFAGYANGRRLAEGDVFYVRDGSRLQRDYKPIPREAAAREHLLATPDKSREHARTEIKKQYAMLSAAQVSAGDEKEARKLRGRVNRKYKPSI